MPHHLARHYRELPWAAVTLRGFCRSQQGAVHQHAAHHWQHALVGDQSLLYPCLCFWERLLQDSGSPEGRLDPGDRGLALQLPVLPPSDHSCRCREPLIAKPTSGVPWLPRVLPGPAVGWAPLPLPMGSVTLASMPRR